MLTHLSQLHLIESSNQRCVLIVLIYYICIKTEWYTQVFRATDRAAMRSISAPWRARGQYIQLLHLSNIHTC